MGKALIAILSILLVSAGLTYFRAGDAGGMMGGGGMMGSTKSLGEAPRQETNKRLLAGYEQAKITCTQCHTLPDPGQHSRTQWPDIMQRMKGHILTDRKVMPTNTEMKYILEYYIGNAASG